VAAHEELRTFWRWKLWTKWRFVQWRSPVFYGRCYRRRLRSGNLVLLDPEIYLDLFWPGEMRDRFEDLAIKTVVVAPRASCIWVYAYPAFLRYAARSAGGYWARILPQASEIASKLRARPFEAGS
jgi:hypothetical protein